MPAKDAAHVWEEGQGVSGDVVWMCIMGSSLLLAMLTVVSHSRSKVSVAERKKSLGEGESLASAERGGAAGVIEAKSTSGKDETATSVPVARNAGALPAVESDSTVNDVSPVSDICGALPAHGDSSDESAPVPIPITLKTTAVNPAKVARLFAAFQTSYLVADTLATFADWLKGAYTMSIYVEYGLTLWQISFLFACAGTSSMIFGTLAGVVSDAYGRVRVCRFYCVAYAASLLLTYSDNMAVLVVARVLSGVSTSLLATSFESWLVAEHQTRGFDPALLQDTFSKSAILCSVSAVVAGFVAEGAVRAAGNIGPFLAPLPFLAAALLYMRDWPENYGDRTVSLSQTFLGGWHDVRRSTSLQLLWICEATYEASLGVWLFAWTPALDSTKLQTPFGLVFVAFTLCITSGGMLTRILSLDILLPLCHMMGLISMAASAIFFESKATVFVAFLLYEMSTGIYMSSHPVLRSQLMKNSSRSSVMNLFRVPMNLVIVIVLFMNRTPHELLCIFTGMHIVSTVVLFILQRRTRSPRGVAPLM